MDDAGQATAYALADFSEPHNRFVACFRERFPTHDPLWVLDLGCGSADVTIRFARAFPRSRIVGVDAAPAMLAHARGAVAGANLETRVQLVQARLPGASLPDTGYDTAISNSLLHHLADPAVLWSAVTDHARAGAAVFIMDLRRPGSRAQAQHLVQAYAGDEHPLLKRDFFDSLCAAYSQDEVSDQLERASVRYLRVESLGDRHLIIHGIRD